MMNPIIAIYLILFTSTFLYANLNQKYSYRKLSTEKTDSITMQVHIRGDTATILNCDNSKLSTTFLSTSNNLPYKFTQKGISDSDNIAVEWDYKHGQIFFNGTKMPLSKNNYINSGSLFYVFGKIAPRTLYGKTKCNLLSINGKNTFEVALEYVKNEGVLINNNSIDCKKISMRLIGVPGIFWPYKYYYWYSIQDDCLIRYQGPDASKNIETIELR